MNQLIKITTNEQGSQVVSARELHEKLESKERFSKWFDKMLKFGFDLNIDYTPYQMVHPSNNETMLDYAITLDMAKELSMVSRLPKGKEVRQYFIECEKKLSQATQPKLPTVKELALMVLKVEEEKEKLAFDLENKTYELEKATEVIKEQAPKAEYTDKVLLSKSTYTANQVASDLGMTAQGLNSLLRNKQIIYKQSGTYFLYGKYRGLGLAEQRTHVFKNSKDEEITSTQLVWTEKAVSSFTDK